MQFVNQRTRHTILAPASTDTDTDPTFVAFRKETVGLRLGLSVQNRGSVAVYLFPIANDEDATAVSADECLSLAAGAVYTVPAFLMDNGAWGARSSDGTTPRVTAIEFWRKTKP